MGRIAFRRVPGEKGNLKTINSGDRNMFIFIQKAGSKINNYSKLKTTKT